MVESASSRLDDNFPFGPADPDRYFIQRCIYRLVERQSFERIERIGRARQLNRPAGARLPALRFRRPPLREHPFHSRLIAGELCFWQLEPLAQILFGFPVRRIGRRIAFESSSGMNLSMFAVAIGLCSFASRRFVPSSGLIRWPG